MSIIIRGVPLAENKTFWNSLVSGEFAKKVEESTKMKPFSSPESIYNIVKPLMAAHPDKEIMYGFFLNRQNQLLKMEQVAIGSISSSPVYPREIMKKCFEHRATALILAHNHPSGFCDLSSSDLKITKTMIFATNIVDIAFHDHIIVGGSEFISMADKGYIQQWREEFDDFMEINET